MMNRILLNRLQQLQASKYIYTYLYTKESFDEQNYWKSEELTFYIHKESDLF